MPTSPRPRLGLLTDDFPFADEVLAHTPEDDPAGDAPGGAGEESGVLTRLTKTHADPIPPEVDADMRALDRSLAKMIHRTSERIARSHLYFSDENLRALGAPAEADGIADQVELKARGLLLRAEAPHTQKYMTWAGSLRAAALAAERAARLADLLERDRSLAPSLAALRRVGDAAQRIFLYTATTLETAETRHLARVVRYQQEMAEACARAEEVLARGRGPAEAGAPPLQPLPAERMTRAALWSVFVAAECAALVGHQYTEVLAERRVREAHRAHTAAKFSAAAARKALASLIQEDGWSLDAHPLPVGDAAPADADAEGAEPIAVLRPTPPPSAIPSPDPLMRRVAPRRGDAAPSSRAADGPAGPEAPREPRRPANTKVRRGLAAVARLFAR